MVSVTPATLCTHDQVGEKLVLGEFFSNGLVSKLYGLGNICMSEKKWKLVIEKKIFAIKVVAFTKK